jgi:hypothetical protein
MPALPRKAVVLAAGLGTRLRPLTWVQPKPLVPVWGTPLVLRIVAMLERWGVGEIHVNLHWRPEQVRAALEGRRGTARIRFSPEPEILGTGGALRPLRDALSGGPFWVVNADIVASVEPRPFLDALAADERRIAAAWLDPSAGPRTVEVRGDGTIGGYRSLHPGAAGTATFCGLQLVHPGLLDFLPEKHTCSLIEAYERAAAAGRPVAGVVARRSFWADAGTAGDYLRIHGETRRRAAAGRAGGEYFDPAAAEATAPAAFRRRAVFWPGAGAAAGARLTDVVVAGGATAGGAWRRAALIPARAAPEPALAAALDRLGWPEDETVLSYIGERGSNRVFWRAGWGRRRAILVTYGLERPENGRYAGHARLLAEAGVPVPAVLADLPTERALALADWGDVSLEDRVRRRPSDAERLYAPVLAATARLHGAATELAFRRSLAMEPAFDATVFRWEHDLFREHLLRRRCGLAALPDEASAELAAVAGRLLAAPRVIVHRDLQSSNVLCRGGRIALIDFQGMRPGPAAYDLASLLCDPYVRLPDATRRRLLARYAALCPEQAEAATALFAWAAVQRLVQALGAYGRLAGLGLGRFAAFIAPAAVTLAEMASACGLPALAGVADGIRGHESRREPQA